MNKVITLVKFFSVFDNFSNIKNPKPKKTFIHRMCFKILSIILAATTVSYSLSVGQFVLAISVKSSVQSTYAGNIPSFKSTSLRRLPSWLCTKMLAWVQSNAQVLAISGCIVTFNILKITSMDKNIKELEQKINNLELDIKKNSEKMSSEITDISEPEAVRPIPPPPPPPPPATPINRRVASTHLPIKPLQTTPRSPNVRSRLILSPGRLKQVKLRKVTTVDGVTLSPLAMARASKKQHTQSDRSSLVTQLSEQVRRRRVSVDPDSPCKK